MLLDRMAEVLPPTETKSKWVIVLPVTLNAPPGSFDSDGELVPGEKGEDEGKLQVPALKKRKSGEALAVGIVKAEEDDERRWRKVPVIKKEKQEIKTEGDSDEDALREADENEDDIGEETEEEGELAAEQLEKQLEKITLRISGRKNKEKNCRR